MAEFLAGKQLAEAIARLIEEGNARCAVAFWGPHYARLAAQHSAKIVLDVSMGSTSKNALLALGVPDNNDVRVLDGLHAKLYIGASEAIVSSANASKNALGDEQRAPVLSEIGVRITEEVEPAAFAAAEKQFRLLWKAGQLASQADLDRAARTPVGVAARDIAEEGAPVFSLLGLVLQQPERFSHAAFTFGDERMDDDEEESALRAYESLPAEDRATKREVICITSDRGEDRTLEEASYILMYWFGSSPGLTAYHDITRVPVGRRTVAYFGRKNWSTVRSRLGISSAMTRDGYWEKDRELARAIAAKEGDPPAEQFVILKNDELFELLEQGRLRPPP